MAPKHNTTVCCRGRGALSVKVCTNVADKLRSLDLYSSATEFSLVLALSGGGGLAKLKRGASCQKVWWKLLSETVSWKQTVDVLFFKQMVIRDNKVQGGYHKQHDYGE
jgi:hypothetical protein